MRLPLLLLTFVACATSQTTSPGLIGRSDLSAKLPEGVSKGSEDPTAEHERSAEVCVSGAPGAKVKIRWQTFTQGKKRYVAGYNVELVKSAEGVAVNLGEARVGGTGDGSANADPETPYVGQVTIVLTCKKNGEDLKSESIQITADGR